MINICHPCNDCLIGCDTLKYGGRCSATQVPHLPPSVLKKRRVVLPQTPRRFFKTPRCFSNMPSHIKISPSHIFYCCRLQILLHELCHRSCTEPQEVRSLLQMLHYFRKFLEFLPNLGKTTSHFIIRESEHIDIEIKVAAIPSTPKKNR